MENQFHAGLESNALYHMNDKEGDFGFYDVTVLNKTNTN